MKERYNVCLRGYLGIENILFGNETDMKMEVEEKSKAFNFGLLEDTTFRVLYFIHDHGETSCAAVCIIEGFVTLDVSGDMYELKGKAINKAIGYDTGDLSKIEAVSAVRIDKESYRDYPITNVPKSFLNKIKKVC